jgi:hypothetical protein
MAQTAVHIVDHIIPEVPVRQFVVTFPYQLRLWLAASEEMLGDVCGMIARTIMKFIISQSEAECAKPKVGLICFVQRFGSALNLNPHLHFIVTDGVFDTKSTGREKFYYARAPNNEEAAMLIQQIAQTVNDYLVKRQFLSDRDGELLLENTTDLFTPDVDTEVHLPSMMASLTQRIAFGPRAGQPVTRLFDNNGRLWPEQTYVEFKGDRCVAHGGYSIHANTCVHATQKERLEKLIAYMSRAPIADDRIEIISDDKIRIKLKTQWHDGTTHMEFTPNEFIEKLVAVIPPPWFHLTRYFGVFASNAKERREIVPKIEKIEGDENNNPSIKKVKRRLTWAQLLKRIFGIDAERCPRCGGKLKIVEVLFPGDTLSMLLDGLGLPNAPPKPASAKVSPMLFSEDW